MTAQEIAPLVSEAVKLHGEVASLKTKSERLDEIKGILRKEAGDQDAEYSGANPGETAAVKQVNDGVGRSIPDEILSKVRLVAGRMFWRLFRPAPIKDFKIESYKALDRKKAEKLIKLMTLPGTARVSFTSPAAE